MSQQQSMTVSPNLETSTNMHIFPIYTTTKLLQKILWRAEDPECLNQHCASRSFQTTMVGEKKNKFPAAATLAWMNSNIFSRPGTSREFIIELRLRKYSLRRCQSPEEATLNVFRYHWDCCFPRAPLFSSWRAKVWVWVGLPVCSFVCVCVFQTSMCLYSCVIVCIGLINSQVRGAPSAWTAFDGAGAGWVGRSCHPLCETNYW